MSRAPGLRLGTAARLAAIQWAVTFLSAILVFWLVFRAMSDLLEAEARARAETELRGLAELHGAGGAAALAGAIEDRLAGAGREAAVYLLLDREGRRLAGNLPAWPEGLAPGGPPATRRLAPVGGPPLAVDLHARALPDGARLLLGRDARAEARAREALGGAMLLGLGAAALVAGLVGWAVSRMLIERMAGITEAAEGILAGDLSRRVPARAEGDEFDRLAQLLNAMIARLEAQMGELRLACESMAHDLRSPLTRLSLHLAALPEAARGEALDRARAELAGIERIIAALLEIARAEAGIGRAQMARLSLGAAAADTVEFFEPLAEARDVRLLLEGGAAGPEVLGHRELLVLALSNLVENALRVAPEGSAVSVAAERTAGGARLTVADAGPGLPPEGAEGSAGAGLGFSLVRAVARLHGGRLVFETAEPGLRARVELPAEPPD